MTLLPSNFTSPSSILHVFQSVVPLYRHLSLQASCPVYSFFPLAASKVECLLMLVVETESTTSTTGPLQILPSLRRPHYHAAPRSMASRHHCRCHPLWHWGNSTSTFGQSLSAWAWARVPYLWLSPSSSVTFNGSSLPLDTADTVKVSISHVDC